jgi:hypothetical protein
MGLIDSVFALLLSFMQDIGKIIFILFVVFGVGLVLLAFICLIWGLMLP